MSLTQDQVTAQNFKAFYDAIRPYLNGAAHSGFTPVGTVISVMGTTAPLNYLACNGQVVNIADYPELATYFTGQFGSANFFGGNGATTFAVPDLRGEFLRGTGTNSHSGQGNGANVGVHQDATEHVAILPSSGAAWIGGSSGTTEPNTINADVYPSSHSKNVKLSSSTTTKSQSNSDSRFTSRPTNTSVLYCIATKNIFMDAGMNYSTTEQVVGTWIDGKPLYQKVIDCGEIPSGQQSGYAMYVFDANITNVRVINACAYKNSYELQQTIPYINPASRTTEVGFQSIKNSSTGLYQLTLRTESDRSSFGSILAIVQYTKTTD